MVQGVKRRYRSDSSEPGQGGAVTIENYLAGKDSYRVAPPNEIPTPWPYVKCLLPQGSEELFATIRNDCVRICEHHFITIRDIKVDALMRKDFDARATTCLIIETNDDDTARWQHAASDLRDLVQKASHRDRDSFKVEIRNPSKMYCDTSSCLPNNPNLLQYIMDIKPKILEIVQTKLASSWTSIAYHMRGPRFGGNGAALPKPTVLVFVKPGTGYFFEEVEAKLVEALTTSSFPGMYMNLEILAGTVSRSIQMDSDPKSYSWITSTMPFNGVSIGARNLVDETGSLGGWVRLTSKSDPRQILDCVLSAYHMFEKADKEGELDNAVSGIGFFGAHLVADIEVVWPSNLDEEYTRSLCERKVTEGSKNPEFATALSVLDRIRGAERTIGKIRWASGHETRTPSKGRLDWAVIPSPNTSQLNRPPQLTVRGSPYIDGTYCPGPNDYVRAFGSRLKQTDWVIRAGRTSEAQGLVNKVRRTVNWEDDEKHNPSEEMEILPIDKVEFCGAGDSGSWIFNEKHELVAMLIGHANGQEKEGIATPIQDIIDDIEHRTKCKVSLP